MKEQIIMLSIGAVIGFVVSVGKDFINYILNKKEKEKDLTLQRLDDIFILLSKNANFSRTILLINTIPPKKEEFDDTGARLGFLIRVYFPCLHEEYKEFLKQVSEYVVYQIEISQSKSKLDKNKLYGLSKSFESHYASLCTSIVLEAKKYK